MPDQFKKVLGTGGLLTLLLTVGHFSPLFYRKSSDFPMKSYGGRGGIRTHGSLATTSDFESDALDHSATLPTVDFISLFKHLRPPVFHRTPRHSIMQSLRDQPPNTRKHEEHLSKDGKWRSFPKAPHPPHYVISGNYFGKVKINGNHFAI